jgi:hypothetical protein
MTLTVYFDDLSSEVTLEQVREVALGAHSKSLHVFFDGKRPSQVISGYSAWRVKTLNLGPLGSQVTPE